MHCQMSVGVHCRPPFCTALGGRKATVLARFLPWPRRESFFCWMNPCTRLTTQEPEILAFTSAPQTMHWEYQIKSRPVPAVEGVSSHLLTF